MSHLYSDMAFIGGDEEKEGSTTQKLWWLNLIRGIVALIIGILIFTWPQKGQDMFANFFAMYLLSSGLLSLRGGMSAHQKKGWWLVASLLEMVAGAAILLRFVYAHYLAPGLAVKIFGLVTFCVGLLCIFGGDTSRDVTREQAFGLLLLGLFEAGLGLILFFLGELEPFTKLLTGGWAFLGGILFILQSLQLRRVALTSSRP
jgi:uncharacterized membrane protein HdeD (DUF308 family)